VLPPPNHLRLQHVGISRCGDAYSGTGVTLRCTQQVDCDDEGVDRDDKGVDHDHEGVDRDDKGVDHDDEVVDRDDEA
jgi:hypothetical protein